MEGARPMLAVDAVVKHYATGDEVVRALDGVSLSVRSGELVALYGPSGSGKTTLLTIVAALIAPDAGTVAVGGRDLGGLGRRELVAFRRERVGYVAQTPELLWGASALDNAALKLIGLRASADGHPLSRREAQQTVAPLLGRLGLGHRLEHRPDELSTGERQRVMMARALSTDPPLVLADEPTGALDVRRGGDLLELLAEVCHERATALLMATHDPRAADFADRVLELRDGRLGAWVA